MKIAFIGQKGIPCVSGGVEKHVEELATRLADRGHEVFAYSRKHYVPDKVSEYKGVKLVYTPTINTKHLDAIVHTLTASLHAIFCGYDIIHYHAVGPSFLSFIPRILTFRTKVVSTFHCQDWTHKKWGAFARGCLRLGAWMSVKSPHQTIAVSKILQGYCAVQYHADVEYIPNGIPDPTFVPPRLIARKLNLKKDEYILAVSRLIPHKGIHTLIEAFRQVETDKKLVLVGGGSFTDSYVKDLQELAAKDDRVMLVGEQHGDIMKEFFSNAYAFCQPSESEGLPITILEAMSYGRCVIASDIPENMEALSNTGLPFRNKDIADLAANLSQVVIDPKQVSMKGAQAKTRAREHYHWTNIVNSIEFLYTELLSPEAKPVLAKK